MPIVDDDLVKADLALAELPRARMLPLESARQIVRHLASTTGNDGSRRQSIERAQADAWLSICTIGKMLDQVGHCPDEQWDRAIMLTKRWRELLI